MIRDRFCVFGRNKFELFTHKKLHPLFETHSWRVPYYTLWSTAAADTKFKVTRNHHNKTKKCRYRQLTFLLTRQCIRFIGEQQILYPFFLRFFPNILHYYTAFKLPQTYIRQCSRQTTDWMSEIFKVLCWSYGIYFASPSDSTWRGSFRMGEWRNEPNSSCAQWRHNKREGTRSIPSESVPPPTPWPTVDGYPRVGSLSDETASPTLAWGRSVRGPVSPI
jgi:hypothetical protein